MNHRWLMVVNIDSDKTSLLLILQVKVAYLRERGAFLVVEISAVSTSPLTPQA